MSTNRPIVDQIAWTVALLLSGVAAGMFLMDCFGTWTPDAPPAGWKTLFSEMIFREQLRTALPTMAFVLALTASRRRA